MLRFSNAAIETSNNLFIDILQFSLYMYAVQFGYAKITPIAQAKTVPKTKTNNKAL
jgi:hypothetical protein